ncbi:MAG: type II toxin-antitoxin system PemK/MazF family toxin [Candidatus Sericytochromatia bacterium]
MTRDKNPKRGDIWLVEFEPQIASEIKKTRPAVVVSFGGLDTEKTRIVVPIRDRKEHHFRISFFVPISPTNNNGLSKDSTIDCIQIKSFDLLRFKKKIGKVTTEQLDEITKLIAIEVGYI